MTRVVINNCFGGFGISRECADFMKKLGSEAAATALRESIAAEARSCYLDPNYPRHCSTLIKAIETLGSRANGVAAQLEVVQLKGDVYMIKEYDGLETVVEPKDIPWVHAK